MVFFVFLQLVARPVCNRFGDAVTSRFPCGRINWAFIRRARSRAFGGTAFGGGATSKLAQYGSIAVQIYSYIVPNRKALLSQ